MEYGVRFTLAYDGTEFCGFARQRDTRTVQGVLEQALERITQHPVQTRGAARTDAGVHAEGQVVAFATTRSLPPDRWLLAANRYLPDDVAVHDAGVCEPSYDPRFDAFDKTYRYLFYLGFGRHPLLRNRAWHLARDAARKRERGAQPASVAVKFDLDAMQLAAEAMVGTHDFRAFRAADDPRAVTERTLFSVTLTPQFHGERNLLALEIRGNAFMKNMVRVLAGTLVAVGRGQLSPAGVAKLLLPGAERSVYSETAPARGLTLVRMTLGRIRATASRSA